MKRILSVVFTILLIGCSPIPHCEDGSRIIIIGEYPRVMTADSVQWSVVKVSDLVRYCWRHDLCYVGSSDQYHYIMWYAKPIPITDKPIVNAESHFAISMVEYNPDTIVNYPSHWNYIKLFPDSK
jgi:hypothetical protein